MADRQRVGVTATQCNGGAGVQRWMRQQVMLAEAWAGVAPRPLIISSSKCAFVHSFCRQGRRVKLDPFEAWLSRKLSTAVEAAYARVCTCPGKPVQS